MGITANPFGDTDLKITAFGYRLPLISPFLAIRMYICRGLRGTSVLSSKTKYLNSDRIWSYRENNLEREAWDSSTENAKTLTFADFGAVDEVRKMAEPIRQAVNRYEAEKALENIISNNGAVKRSAIELKNKSGFTAMLRRSSIGKLVSGIQGKDISKEALYLAVANIDRLFENAIEPWEFELNPLKNNDGLKDRRIFYAPLKYEGRIIPVKITVKEYLDPLAKAKLYSIEVIDFVLDKKKEDAGTLTAINRQ